MTECGRSCGRPVDLALAKLASSLRTIFEVGFSWEGACRARASFMIARCSRGSTTAALACG